MPNQAPNQIPLGDYVYLFKSPNRAATDCVISAHGSQIREVRFNVPPRVSVHFMAEFNYPVRHQAGPIRFPLKGRPEAPLPLQTTAGGNQAPDQLLGKSLGHHWRDKRGRDGAQYYEFVEHTMQTAHQLGHWAPHFVSIRNRRHPTSDDYVWLSEVIRLVTEHNDAIVNFYSFACRREGKPKMIHRAGPQAFQN